MSQSFQSQCASERRHEAKRSRITITPDDLTSPEIAALLREHMAEMHRNSPPESIHALDLDALRAPNITFWSAYRDGALVGCVAISELSPVHGEIKSMRTASAHQRTGVGAALLQHVIDEASRRGYLRLSLETGAQDHFAPARTLYSCFGFVPCGPFANYSADPNSVFMAKGL